MLDVQHQVLVCLCLCNNSIRSVIKNVDDYLLESMGKLFSFNMQFDFDPEIKVI